MRAILTSYRSPVFARVPAFLHSVICFALVGAAVAAQGAPASQKQRDWQVTDSIAVRYFSNLDGYLYDPQIGSREPGATGELPSVLVAISPDGNHFFCVTHHGDLADDANVYELRVYSAASVAARLDGAGPDSLVPVASATFRSYSSQAAGIAQPRWTSDGGAITFLGTVTGAGEAGAELLRLQRLVLPSGRVEILTQNDTRLRGVEQRDGAAIYFTQVSTPKDWGAAYPAWIPAMRADGSLRPQEFGRVERTGYCLAADGSPHRLETPIGAASIAPGGRWAIAVRRGKEGAAFIKLDLKDGKTELIAPLAAGPVEPLATWCRDGEHVVLVGAAPSAVASSSANPVWEYDLMRRTWQEVEGVPQELLIGVHESTAARGFIGEFFHPRSKARRFVEFKLESGKWTQQTVAGLGAVQPALAGGIVLSVRQSINTPPELIASRGSQAFVLLAANPTLGDVSFTKAEAFSWPEEGRTAAGWLLLPKDRRAERLPLVIQLSPNIDGRIFAPDGATPNGYAAQALAARGCAVLLMPGFALSSAQAADEGGHVVRRFEAAIKALAEKSIIDPDRVGAVGHSRMGYQVFYETTHPGTYPLAASAVLDSFTGTYPGLLSSAATFSDLSQTVVGFDGIYGGTPWSQHEAEWLLHEATLNLNRVRTPVLLADHGKQLPPYTDRISDSDVVPLMGAFRLNHKPLELLWLPRADHLLHRPRERQVEMQAVVDWMCFWLKGETPSDPERAARWAVLRKQQDEVLKTPPPPKGKWVFVPEADQTTVKPTPASVKGSGTD